jgi:hypothetical protein
MSSNNAQHSPTLRLIRGDLDQVVRLGHLSIQLAPHERPPFAVTAVAVEQDTALVLDEEPVLNVPHSSLKQLGEEMERFTEPVPGSILVLNGSPYRLYSVVHDLEQEPSWREEWVQKALENLLRLVERQHLSPLALPLLGNRFGNLAPERFIQLLCNAAERFPPSSNIKVWLVVPRHTIHHLLQTLRHYAND